MPVNSSATGGFLGQTNTTPTDEDVENGLQAFVVGTVGLPAALVRPRYQVDPPNQPPVGTSWCAIGVMTDESIDYPQLDHFNGGPTRQTRWQTLHVLASFYGPQSSANTKRFRDALYIPQNWEPLMPLGMKLHSVEPIRVAPAILINTQWVGRADLSFSVAQVVQRDYNILDIVAAPVTIQTEDGVTTHSD